MTLMWLVTGVSLLAALAAWGQAWRTAKRLEQISQMYWELKYQYGELRVQMQQQTPGPDAPGAAPATATRPPGEAFVPLTSLKR